MGIVFIPALTLKKGVGQIIERDGLLKIEQVVIRDTGSPLVGTL